MQAIGERVLAYTETLDDATMTEGAREHWRLVRRLLFELVNHFAAITIAVGYQAFAAVPFSALPERGVLTLAVTSLRRLVTLPRCKVYWVAQSRDWRMWSHYWGVLSLYRRLCRGEGLVTLLRCAVTFLGCVIT